MHVPGWWAGAAADSVGIGMPAWVSNWGAEGVLVLAIALIFTGGLVPWRTVRRIEADRDAYRKAAELKDQVIKQLTESSEITLDVLRALEKLASQKDATS